MVSKLKNLFTRSTSKEAKFSLRLDALLCRGHRTLSSQSITSKKNCRELENANSRREPNGKSDSRRVPIQAPVTQQTRLSPVLGSACDPVDDNSGREEALPALLSENTTKDLEIQEATDSPGFPSPQASCQDSNSESQSSDSNFFENITSHHSHSSSEKLESPDTQGCSVVNFPEVYYTPPETSSTEEDTQVKHPNHLMNALLSHEIEWAAMIELQKADHTGILQGLTSRQIRWLVREGRSKTWLIGTAGPLIEEAKDDSYEVQMSESTLLVVGPSNEGGEEGTTYPKVHFQKNLCASDT